jgi:hypothetical protein
MNLTPSQVDEMTFASFHAVIGGYLKANSSSDSDSGDLTEAEYLRVLSEEKMMGRA